jgi:hypothetical protein
MGLVIIFFYLEIGKYDLTVELFVIIKFGDTNFPSRYGNEIYLMKTFD